MREHKKEMAMLVHNQCQLPQKRFLVKKTEQIPTWVIITTMIPHKTKKKQGIAPKQNFLHTGVAGQQKPTPCYATGTSMAHIGL